MQTCLHSHVYLPALHTALHKHEHKHVHLAVLLTCAWQAHSQNVSRMLEQSQQNKNNGLAAFSEASSAS